MSPPTLGGDTDTKGDTKSNHHPNDISPRAIRPQHPPYGATGVHDDRHRPSGSTGAPAAAGTHTHASPRAPPANATDAECAPTDPKSPPSVVTIGPYPHSEDDLQAAAAIALRRLVGPVNIISIQTHHGR